MWPVVSRRVGPGRVARTRDRGGTAAAWSLLGVDDCLTLLSASAGGLSAAEAGRRLADVGPNELAQERGPNLAVLVVRQFASPLIYILILAALVTAATGEYVDASVIGVVLVFNAIVGFSQEHRAERSMAALRRMMSTQARVFRDGDEREVDAREVVPGDVVLVEAGAKAPADCRVVHAVSLEADESLLTGESATVGKHAEPLAGEGSVDELTNMLFMGTVITHGRGRALVVATGEDTRLGMVAGSISGIDRLRAPLQQRMDRFARVIGLAVIVLFALGFSAGLATGESPHQLFLTLVALAVSAVPEGLPIVITVALAIGLGRMARRNVIIRRLAAVETLGSCTVIASDKTGTLTENRMTVVQMRAGGRSYEVTGAGYEVSGEVRVDGKRIDLETWHAPYVTLLAGALCNDADIVPGEGEFVVRGDPTEIALLVSAAKAGLYKDEVEDRYPRVAEVPFDAERRYAATFHEAEGRTLVFVKGAPEEVLAMCSDASGEPMLDRDRLLHEARVLADRGLRVLAMAWRTDDVATGGPLEHRLADLTFAGMQAMIDPPRAEVAAAVRGCKHAGIRVMMVTGDHAATALEIARRLHIAGESDRAVTGAEIDGADEAALEEIVRYVPVFARVQPQHKLSITRALQRQDHVVAVTGDGVNDAPALKAADIGVAMGRSGTEVAKDAADMVITDDNFASIFAAVDEGRIAFDNVRKVTFMLISTGVAEVIAVLASVAFTFRLPFLPAQLLWLNLVTNGVEDVALAFEPGDPDVLRRKPRPRREGIISPLLWERTAIVGAVLAAGTLLLFLLELRAGASSEHARSVALTTMVLFQVFHIGNCRSESLSIFAKSPTSNPFLLVGTAAALAIHVVALYLPFTQYVLRVEPLGLWTWLKMLAVASSIVIVVELHKMLRSPRRGG
jgi:magnesium-transporting ATPase (P-type)